MPATRQRQLRSKRALAFTAAVSLASALLFGLAAAVRYSGPRVLARLRQAGRGSVGGRERHFARNALVVSQCGLALVLLVGSGLLVRSFAELMEIDPGFDTDNILSFQVALPTEQYETPVEAARFHATLMERLAGLPTPAEVYEQWHELTGRSIEGMAWFELFAVVRYAFILELKFIAMREANSELGNIPNFTVQFIPDLISAVRAQISGT